MKKMINRGEVIGYVYEHDLKIKISGENSKKPGSRFITGSISIATEEDCSNVVKVFYSYIGEFDYSKPSVKNPIFDLFNGFIEGTYKTVVSDGIENAAKIQTPVTISLFERYNGDDFISAKTLSGGSRYINLLKNFPTDSSGKPQLYANFEVDMVITNCMLVEANEERNIPEKVILKGAIFTYKKELLPVEFSVFNPKAKAYFLDQEIANTHPFFINLKGSVVSQTLIKTVETESAWGEVTVKETKSSYKDYIVKSSKSEPYPWDDESTILASEFIEAISNREIYKASLKQPVAKTSVKTEFRF